MSKILQKLGIMGTLLLALALTGCIVSATFIIDDVFYFTLKGDFYFNQVDVTDDEDWEDHKDKIRLIDAVGFELFYTSYENGNVTIDAFVDHYSGFGSDPASVPTSATQVIDDFVIPPGIAKMSYMQSLGAIDNLDSLKVLAKAGQFDVYVTSTGTVGSTLLIDSIRVIVTLTASE